MVVLSDDDERPEPMRVLADGKQWLLLDGNRFVIAIGLTVAFWLTHLLLSVGGIAPLADTQSLFYVFSGLISGNFTLITVVVSITQLVLSQELQSPGELESEITATADYREEIESAGTDLRRRSRRGFSDSSSTVRAVTPNDSAASPRPRSRRTLATISTKS